MKPYEVANRLRNSTLTATQRWLLLCVAFRAGDGGRCYASAATLATDSGLCERHVRRTLRELSACGWLATDERVGRTPLLSVVDPGSGVRNPGSGVTPGTVSGTPALVSGTPDMVAATPGTVSGTPALVSPRTQEPVPRTQEPVPRTPEPTTPDTRADDSIPYSIPNPIPHSNHGGDSGLASGEEEASGDIDGPTVIDLPAAKRKREQPKRSSRASKHPAFDRIKSIWNDKVVPHLQRQGHQIPSHPSLSPSTGLGKSLNGWLHEHDDETGDTFRKLIRWFVSSNHRQAKYLRENGYGLSTLVRPSHYDEYVGFANLHAQEASSKPKRIDPRQHPYHDAIRMLLDTSPDSFDHGRPVSVDDIRIGIEDWGEPTPESVAKAMDFARKCARGER